MAKGKGRKAGSKVPSNETKAQRFVRLAKQRVPKAIKQIANIGKLSGGGYEYTSEQANKIVAALTAAVTEVKEKFAGKKHAAIEFDL